MTMLERLLARVGGEAVVREMAVLAVAPELSGRPDEAVPRRTIAFALNVLLMRDLLNRTPSGAAYVADLRASGGRLTFDHGALRTVAFKDGPTGALPAGEAAFRRILEPLGYREAGLYPLPALRMTGRAYAHLDLPEAIPQLFVSELHVAQFSEAFQAAAHRVFDSAADPISPQGLALLERLAEAGELPVDDAATLLPILVGAFARTHYDPWLADYETLKRESAEAAWIATEGAIFNHVTDRVQDLEDLAQRQRALGRPIKDTIEVSRSGRVRQTAYRADPVVRRFRTQDGEVERMTPGSFYEFISRGWTEDGEGRRLDLAFDTGNAQGIFKMTA